MSSLSLTIILRNITEIKTGRELCQSPLYAVSCKCSMETLVMPRRCYVYRFLTSGTIEEKVFQRQMSKEGLQSIVVDDKMTVNAQSAEDLRNIFQLDDTDSSTHDSLKCKRCSDETDGCAEKDAREDALQTWAHHKNGKDVKVCGSTRVWVSDLFQDRTYFTDLHVCSPCVKAVFFKITL